MRQGVGNAISIMGARPTSNNFMIDGTANIDTSLGTPAAVLSVDAIQEFKEQTTTYSAEYGFSSNQINMVSKTGTNRLHGTGFGFFRNEGWDARNFFDDKTRPEPKLDQKQFGFVVGGPVMLPGYDGRNRTFFLVNYEGTRIDRGATELLHGADAGGTRRDVQHDDHRSGDRSAVSEQHHSASRDFRGSRSWRSGTAGSRRRTAQRRRATIQAVRTFPQNQDQFTIRGDQDLGKFGRAFFRYTQTTYENTHRSQHDRGRRPVFVQDTNNWQVSHSWPIHEHPRQPVPDRPRRRTRRSARHSVLRSPTWTSST